MILKVLIIYVLYLDLIFSFSNILFTPIRLPKLKLTAIDETINKKPLKSFTTKTIWGQNIVNCRNFNFDNVNIEFVGSYKSAFPTYSHPEVAFLGRSNVGMSILVFVCLNLYLSGKSSLLNCLTSKKKVAVVSKMPGCTKMMNLYQCFDATRPVCMVVDLPGYCYAKMSKTQMSDINHFIANYLRHRSSLRIAVLLLDIRRTPQEPDKRMAQVL